ncbi:Plasmodium vivax Vir protein, putative [Plasmodium vivax]|uniref:Vir protein, putative n=1 Tax=Plasmodium vivax TaxID=5855 RepID=A0A1G4E4Q9_PLAVI|nr:Plasmodium vivax Vir protein, putative [Plasmodium vivax]
MCYMYTKKSNNQLKSEMCKYFYYWLGDMILNNISNKHFTPGYLISLYNALNNDGVDIVCKQIYRYIDENNFRNIKLIFDYSEDYVNYKLDLVQPNPPCNESYKGYLDNYVKKYNILHSHCKVEERNDTYCTEFHKHFSDKEHDLLSTWKCKLEGTELKVNLIGDGHGKEVEKAQIERSSTRGARRAELNEMERAGGARATKLMEIQVEGGTHVEHSVPTEPPLETESSVVSSSPEDADSSSISTTSKYIANVASVTGIVIPSYLVYNFTPAGTWINRLFGRTPKMNHNTLADMELINNFSQTGPFNSERSRFDISYRPV